MRTRLRTLEQLMPFATAGELIARNRRRLITTAPLLKTAAVAVAIGVFYVTGIY